MTLQEIFDTVAIHLITQNAVSMHQGSCAYRGDHGRKCAIGCLISDEVYMPSMENQRWHVIAEEVKPSLGLRPGPTHADLLLADLQDVHDRRDVLSWRHALCDVADLHRLSDAVAQG